MRGYTELLRYIKVTLRENYLGTQSEYVSITLPSNTIKIKKYQDLRNCLVDLLVRHTIKVITTFRNHQSVTCPYKKICQLRPLLLE